MGLTPADKPEGFVVNLGGGVSIILESGRMR
jgi:hypothetical protein